MILSSTIKILGTLVVAFCTIKWLTKACQLWWGEEGEQKLKTWAEDAWVRIGDSQPESLVLVPVQFVSEFYDGLLGQSPFSMRSLGRAGVIVSLLLVSSLSFTGVFCQKPFGMDQPPWRSYDNSVQILKSMANNPKLQTQNLDAFKFRENIIDLSTLEGLPYQVMFTVYFVLIIIASTAFLNSVSIAVSRLILREILRADASFLVFLMFLTNLVIVCSLLVLDIVFLSIALNVWTWPAVPLFYALSKLSVFSAPMMVLAATWLSWVFSAPWLKVVVIISLMPSMVLGLLLGGCALGFPFRRAAHLFTTRFLERGLQSKKGLFSYIGEVCFLLSTLIGFVVSLLS